MATKNNSNKKGHYVWPIKNNKHLQTKECKISLRDEKSFDLKFGYFIPPPKFHTLSQHVYLSIQLPKTQSHSDSILILK